MFKVGDVIKVIKSKSEHRYRVISVNSNENLIIRHIHEKENFPINNIKYFEIDETYYRKQKLERICLKLVM